MPNTPLSAYAVPPYPQTLFLMPLFHRSSEKKPRSHRFSFRRHSNETAEASKAAPVAAAQPPAATPASSSYPLSSKFPVPQTPRKQTPLTLPLEQKGSSITSEAATSVSSSLRSPSSLSFLERNSGGTGAVRVSGGAATTAETSSSSSESDSETSDNLPIPPIQKSHASRSISSNSSVSSSRSQSMRNSLADYRQLQCSMSYKNRVAGPTTDTFRNTSSVTSSSGSDSRLSDMRMTDLRMTGMSSSRISEARSSYSRVSERGERASVSMNESVPQQQQQQTQRVSIAETSNTNTSTSSTSQRLSESSQNQNAASSEGVRMTEANVAAMQTRRALQQMVLAMEEEDDSDNESESDFLRRSSSADSFTGHNVLQVSADDYRKFQFRLRQLEDLCTEQARKQSSMEETIEREVRDRTRKVVEAMEKNIAMYKQAKELECEREIQKRISEMSGNGASIEQSGSSRGSVRNSTLRESSIGRMSSLHMHRESEKGKPLEKLFHPRRARRRLEMMKEREEQQKREMEQFREFIRSAEMSATHTEASKAASAALKELGDPQITEALMHSTQEELVEMVCVLRKHVSVQEAQLEEAKSLISAAIEAREEAEDTAREAVELTMQLDSRLERASQEIVFIRDELRESQLYQSRSMSPLDHSTILHGGRNGSRSSSNYNIPFTPSSSC